MKKIRLVLPLLAAIALTIAFTQCAKDTACKAVIKVYYSDNGIDTGQVAANCQVEIGTSSNFASYAQAVGTTDNNGVFEHTFKYEAVLPVIATITKPDGMIYYGSTQIALKPGETVTQPLLILPK